MYCQVGTGIDLNGLENWMLTLMMDEIQYTFIYDS